MRELLNLFKLRIGAAIALAAAAGMAVEKGPFRGRTAATGLVLAVLVRSGPAARVNTYARRPPRRRGR